MSGQLLDTNAALIALSDPDRLPGAVRKALLAGGSRLAAWQLGSGRSELRGEHPTKRLLPVH